MSKAAAAKLLARANAFAPFRFLNRSKLPVLMYHRFSKGEETDKTSRRTLERHLQYVIRHYKVISLSDAVACIRNGEKFPTRSAVITVDDGYHDFSDVAFPVLKELGIPATIYLVTEFVSGNCWIWTDKARHILLETTSDRLHLRLNNTMLSARLGDRESRLRAAGSVNSELKKLSDEDKDSRLLELAAALKVEVPETPPSEFSAMTWDQARRMASAGIEIGSHTATHPILTNVDMGRLEQELSESRAAIAREVGVEPVHFCYPNGNVTRRERDAAESAGYMSAVTTEIRLSNRAEDRFLLPRIDAEPDLHRLAQSTSGFDALKRFPRPA